MEAIKKLFTQVGDILAPLTASQKMSLALAAFALLGGLGYLIYQGSGGSMAVLPGEFSADALNRAQTAFRKLGYSEFKISGAQIHVPKRDLNKYAAALLVDRSLPSDFAEEEERLNRNIGLFTTEAHRREMAESARKRRLSQILRAINELEDAYVDWDTQESGAFKRTKVVKATIYVKPRGGAELSQDLLESLRVFGSSIHAGLKKDNVTVMDLVTGKAYAPVSEDDPHYDRSMLAWKQRTQEYQKRIELALDHIPGVRVSVNVDLDPLRSSIERQQKVESKGFAQESKTVSNTNQSSQKPARSEPGVIPNTPRGLATNAGTDEQMTSSESVESSVNVPSFTITERQTDGHQPKTVQVAISIPDLYYDEVASKRGIIAGTTDAEKQTYRAEIEKIRKEEETSVLAIAQQLIPAGSPASAVVVKTYTQLPETATAPATDWIQTITEVLSQWGGAVVLGLFALWILRQLQKSNTQLPAPATVVSESALASQAAPLGAAVPGTAEAHPTEEAGPRPETERERLQRIVRDDPELTASVLSKWLGEK